jgi:hypothetical protein
MCKNKGKFIVFEKLDCNLQYTNVVCYIVTSITVTQYNMSLTNRRDCNRDIYMMINKPTSEL